VGDSQELVAAMGLSWGLGVFQMGATNWFGFGKNTKIAWTDLWPPWVSAQVPSQRIMTDSIWDCPDSLASGPHLDGGCAHFVSPVFNLHLLQSGLLHLAPSAALINDFFLMLRWTQLNGARPNLQPLSASSGWVGYGAVGGGGGCSCPGRRAYLFMLHKVNN